MNLVLKPNDPQEALNYFSNKMAFTTGPAELKYAREQGMDFVLVDVRAADDYEKDHAKGAISLPEDQWHSFRGLDKDKLNVLYCYSQVCHLAARAAVFFAKKGFSVMELEGGWQTYLEMEGDTSAGMLRSA